MASAQVATGFSQLTYQSLLLSADTNYNLSGIGSAADNDSAGLPAPPFPDTIFADAFLALPQTNDVRFIADMDGQTTVRNDGINGQQDLLFDYQRSPSNAGTMGASIRLTFLFNLTSAINYDLTADFSGDGGPGNFLRLDDEDTGAVVAFETLGNDVSQSGTLGPGQYRLEVRLNRSFSGSGGGSGVLDFGVLYDLTFSEVPAPGAGIALGAAGCLAGARRRRRC